MKRILLAAFLLSLTFISCEKFGASNISKKTITILAPSNNSSDSILTKLFWWEELDGADEYQLQIVSESFTNITSLILDTVVVKNKFSKTLNPGTYQWRIKALNGAYETEWTTYNLTISNTSSLNGQTIGGRIPVNGYKSNSLSVLYKWDAMVHADSYILKVVNSGTADEKSESVITNSKQYSFTAEGNYLWSVQGINSMSATLTSQYVITVDTTRPKLSAYIFPKQLSDTVKTWPSTFSWTHGGTDLTVVTDSIFISTDSTFKTVLKTKIAIDATTVSVDSVTVSAGSKLWWRIRSVDAAGNVGVYSTAVPFRKK